MESPKPSQTVYRLGWVSLFNDLGSEVITRLVPFFVSGVLGAPMSAVGAIEGLADSTATLLKPVFGTVSDRIRKRKAFVVGGYALSSFARPFLAVVGSWHGVAVLRFLDRLGKGVRTAPRDALIADSGGKADHGRHFGINTSMDTIGAVVGVSAFAFWAHSYDQARLTHVNWNWMVALCSLPGLVSVALVVYGVREHVYPKKTASQVLHPALDARPLSPVLKRYFALVALFGLANSSDAFILLRAKELRYSLPQILGLIGLLNLVSAATSIPAAALSDRVGRRTLISIGWGIYALTYAVVGSSLPGRSPWIFASSIAVYGLFYGFTESVEKAWIADLAPSNLRGKAYGWFGLVSGLTALPASVVFGWAWDRFGSAVPFEASAAIAVVANLMLYVLF